MNKLIDNWTLFRERPSWSMGDEMSEDFADQAHA
jgi:hypothetical protein